MRRWKRCGAAALLPLALLVAIGLGVARPATGSDVHPTGLLQICKAAGDGHVTGSFDFTVAGHPYTVAVGSCTGLIELPSGPVTVTESARAGFEVTGISSAPAGTLISSDLAARTAIAEVLNELHPVTVTFVNGSVAPPPPHETGQLRICKVAGSGVTAGTMFSFSVSGVAGTTSVAAGSCSTLHEAFDVGSHVTVQELAKTGFAVSAIAATPVGALLSANLGTGTANLSIGSGVTEVRFTNHSVTPPPPPNVTGCTFTKGYYKNHPWALNPLLGGAGGTLSLGGSSLTRDQLVVILSAPIRGNLSIQLAAQLITAMANMANGASAPVAVVNAIATAKASLTIGVSAGGAISVASSVGQTAVSNLVEILDAYNNGRAAGGPPHCD